MRFAKHMLLTVLLLCASLVQAAAPQVDLTNVVRVRVGSSWGSGAYLGQRLVLSCAHLFRGEGVMVGDVWFSSGEHHAFILRQIDHQWDQSVLELRSQPTARGLPLATTNPRPGETLYAYGYGGDNKVMVTTGRVVGFRATSEYPQVNDWLEMSGRVDSGSSGGPILDQYGRVVGNLWGVSAQAPYQTVGVITGRTRRFLLPWNAQLEAHAISNGWPPGGT